MKRKILQAGSIGMMLLILAMSLDINVKYHFCMEDHQLSVSFGDASRYCKHCMGHHHGCESAAEAHEATAENAFEALHFSSKCCCVDFEKEIRLSEDYTFSSEKPLVSNLPVLVSAHMFHLAVDEGIRLVSHVFFQEKIPYLLTGRLRTIFFSNLKINPLI